MEKNPKREAFQFGMYVLLILVVLTFGEYWIASIGTTWWAVLIFIALMKAWFIVQHYMHLPRLFSDDD
jgi:hypothetical protein